MDIAWAVALRPPPGLMNPFEYQETMYKMIVLGETPERTAKQDVESTKAAMGKPPPKAAVDKLDAMRQRAQELAREKGLIA